MLTIDPADANYLTSAARIRVFEGRQEAARIIQHEGDSGVSARRKPCGQLARNRRRAVAELDAAAAAGDVIEVDPCYFLRVI